MILKWLQLPLLLVVISDPCKNRGNSVFVFATMGTTLAENSRIDEPLANASECVYMFRVQGSICHNVGTLLPVESRTPNFGQLCIFYSDMEAQVNV
jgi:hypothetical protein